MSRNLISRGNSIMIAIPAGGCVSGGSATSGNTYNNPGLPLLVGNDLIGVTDGSYDAGTSGNVTLHLEGIFANLKLKTGDTPAVGDKLYLDNTNHYLTTTSTSNTWAGWAISAGYANGNGSDTVVDLRLKG